MISDLPCRAALLRGKQGRQRMTNGQGTTRTTSGHSLETAAKAFRANLRGELLQPGDDGYEGARLIWNAMFDKKPALIARCNGTADIVHAVNFARENGLLTAVRGGGHNSAGSGSCDDGIMIDLSRMNAVRVDPKARRAWVALLAFLGLSRERRPSSTESDEVLAKDRSPTGRRVSIC
jgi:hypothetical protein